MINTPNTIQITIISPNNDDRVDKKELFFTPVVNEHTTLSIDTGTQTHFFIQPVSSIITINTEKNNSVVISDITYTTKSTEIQTTISKSDQIFCKNVEMTCKKLKNMNDIVFCQQDLEFFNSTTNIEFLKNNEILQEFKATLNNDTMLFSLYTLGELKERNTSKFNDLETEFVKIPLLKIRHIILTAEIIYNDSYDYTLYSKFLIDYKKFKVNCDDTLKIIENYLMEIKQFLTIDNVYNLSISVNLGYYNTLSTKLESIKKILNKKKNKLEILMKSVWNLDLNELESNYNITGIDFIIENKDSKKYQHYIIDHNYETKNTFCEMGEHISYYHNIFIDFVIKQVFNHTNLYDIYEKKTYN